jgi:hemin uptake protein HemP
MSQLKTVNTKHLFNEDEKMIQIEHNDKIYYLRITKDDKLILTK